MRSSDSMWSQKFAYMTAARSGTTGSSSSAARAGSEARHDPDPGGEEPLASRDPSGRGEALDERELVDQRMADERVAPVQDCVAVAVAAGDVFGMEITVHQDVRHAALAERRQPGEEVSTAGSGRRGRTAARWHRCRVWAGASHDCRRDATASTRPVSDLVGAFVVPGDDDTVTAAVFSLRARGKDRAAPDNPGTAQPRDPAFASMSLGCLGSAARAGLVHPPRSRGRPLGSRGAERWVRRDKSLFEARRRRLAVDRHGYRQSRTIVTHSRDGEDAAQGRVSGRVHDEDLADELAVAHVGGSVPGGLQQSGADTAALPAVDDFDGEFFAPVAEFNDPDDADRTALGEGRKRDVRAAVQRGHAAAGGSPEADAGGQCSRSAGRGMDPVLVWPVGVTYRRV